MPESNICDAVRRLAPILAVHMHSMHGLWHSAYVLLDG